MNTETIPSAETIYCPHCHKGFTPEVKPYQDDHLFIDPSQFKVIVAGNQIRLTPLEHRLLACLFYNAGRILTHGQILASVWGWEYSNDVDYVRIYVCRLRHKLEPNPMEPQYIISEPGIGYYFKNGGETI